MDCDRQASRCREGHDRPGSRLYGSGGVCTAGAYARSIDSESGGSMPDFIADTRVEVDANDPNLVHSALTEDWSVWGPSGGHVAAIALRAAMRCSRLDRPASFHCHFLAIGDFAPVEIRVRTLGGGKRAESLMAEVVQGERTLLTATVWMIDDGMKGFEHDFGAMPKVARPADLQPYDTLADNYADWFPIWRSMEGRPLRWNQEPGEPVNETWLRFTDTRIETREADALRQLFWLDFPGWNATCAAHQWPFPFIAPNLDLTVQFHQFAPEADWMLAEGYVPIAGDGLVGCVSRIWTEDGRLLATGTSKHLCRPNPRYEEEVAMAKEMEISGEES
jgi:acyl-CoA thioesterase II